MVDTMFSIITKPPYGLEDAFAGLRLAYSQMASGTFFRSDVLLMDDGVFNAVKTQESEAVGMPSNLDAISDLLGFECKVFCVREDLGERMIPEVMVTDMVKMISRKEIPAILEDYEIITTC